MDQKRIGAFIAQCRKEKNLTQIQLAEKLGITNQAVSKWETGKGMPDVSLLPLLSEVLGVSLNELFSGERLSEEEYRGRAEENISRLFREKERVNLKPVRHLFALCGYAALTVAVIELAIGMIGSFFASVPDSNLLEVMMYNASVWFVLYLLSMGKVMYDKKRLKTAKQSGVCIEAEVKEIVPVPWVRVGSYISCKIECDFWYKDRMRTARSSYYVLTPFQSKDNLHVFVYPDRENPNKACVELFQEA